MMGNNDSDMLGEVGGVGGRPKGKRNALHEKMAGLAEAGNYSDPAIELLKYINMDVGALAELLDCDLLAAAEYQLKCSKAVMPYIHRKMPTEFEVNNKSVQIVMTSDRLGALDLPNKQNSQQNIIDVSPTHQQSDKKTKKS